MCCPLTLFMSLNGSRNKQRIFTYTVLTEWYLLRIRSVFNARYGLGLEDRIR
jgi:hypothetical protein